MQSTITVLTPAASIDLMTLDELKVALNITGTAQDAMLGGIITRVSDEIGRLCNNRVFGKERVTETFTEVGADCNRLFLARYPLTWSDIETINDAPLVPNGNLMLDAAWGKLTSMSGWGEGTTLTYSGGYVLPAGAPPALKQAVVALSRESYYASLRGDATVRMIGHKESRIIYFDPNVLARSMGGAGTGGSPAMRAAHDVLVHFTRYEI